MTLFCLPYAGGSKTIYYKWKQWADKSLTIVPIELRGRGKRISEPFYETIEEAVNDILRKMDEKMDEDDYALFGHSMGGLLCYELYYKIRECNRKEPKHIFFSGFEAPCISQEKDEISQYSDEKFLDEIIMMNGMSPALLESSEFISYFLPIIKNDFRLFEAYQFKPKEFKIGCDITILNGIGDSIKLEYLNAWKNCADKGFRIFHFEGNHFFINNHVQAIVEMMNETLTK